MTGITAQESRISGVFLVVMVVEKRRQHNCDGVVEEDRHDNRGSVVKRERRQ